MIKLVIEPNEHGHFFLRTTINDELLVADGKTPTKALKRLNRVTKKYQNTDLFVTGFTLIPQDQDNIDEYEMEND